MPLVARAFVLFTAVAAAALPGRVSAAPAADEITSLPGWSGPLPSKQYSGYLELPGGKKHIHYWFVTAEEGDPSSMPVTLWLNGGPGCSSLDGFLYEHGPFRFDEHNHSKLVRFNYTWARRSNMLYIEAPVGVGFSYSTDSADYNCTDDTTATDNLHAVEQFYTLFPEYKSNRLAITGESYGGVYVPTLAEAIVKATEAGTYAGAKLFAIAVGNGCSGTEIGVCGGQRTLYDAEYFAKHTSLLGPDLQDRLNADCDWTDPSSISKQCQVAIDQMGPLLDRINIYDVYGECITGTRGLKAPVLHADAPEGPDACINSIEASDYMNRMDVQRAIHVKPIDYRWATCGSVPGWQYTSTRPNLPRDTYPLLLKNMRVVIMNGDFDACVPLTDGMAWTKGMGFPASKPWHPWTYEDQYGSQVGGYAINYDTGAGNFPFTFTTVRGGRHEIPETAPKAAFELFTRLISGKPF